MAVDTQSQSSTSPSSSVRSGKRFLVGTNVFMASLLMTAVVGVSQWLAFGASWQVDLTSSGINSIDDATKRLLRNLDDNVRITSLYYASDQETEDQPRFRRTVKDLIELFAGANRSKIIADFVNPAAKDKDKLIRLKKRLRELPAFKEELATHEEPINQYKNELDDRMRELVQQELDAMAAASGGIRAPGSSSILDLIEQQVSKLAPLLKTIRNDVDALTQDIDPDPQGATIRIRQLYTEVKRTLDSIGQYDVQEVSNPGLSPEEMKFLRGAADRYDSLTSDLDQAIKKLQSLKPLAINEVLREIQSVTGNAILVETDEAVEVIDFPTAWPPREEGRFTGRIKDHMFKGQQKITSAVLRLTNKERIAVMFVRYGGPPLFADGGGGMFRQQQQQPPGLYRLVKEYLEDANFVVEEWDLKGQTTQPTIDPPPTRTVYVVLKPNPPENAMPGQPVREPPFGDVQRDRLIDALGDDGRGLFIAGWSENPAMLPGLPNTYEYGDYLKKQWGINVDASTLLVQAISSDPGKYILPLSLGGMVMTRLEPGEEEILSGSLTNLMGLTLCAPLTLSDPLPEGVDISTVLIQSTRNGLWGIKDIMHYAKLQQEQDFVTKAEDDSEGPFTVAVAGEKGDAKVVVVSSNHFAEDQIALYSQGYILTGQSLIPRYLFPGNITLLINSLHWLSGNTDFMDIGKPVESSVLRIKGESTVTAVRAFAIFIWPALALVCGGIAWWVRRR